MAVRAHGRSILGQPASRRDEQRSGDIREIVADKILAEWFWTDRWMGSSGFLLPMEARGVYREMLTQAWRRGARLPNDHEAIRRAIGATVGEWRRAWPIVKKFWRVDGEGLVNDTQLEVYADAQGRAQAAHEKAVKAAQARHGHIPSIHRGIA